MTLTHPLSFTAPETEDDGRFSSSRRRNSDSSLYCKAREEEVRERKQEPEITVEDKTKYLDSKKEDFVLSYLQSIRDETRSLTTEASDSGVKTNDTQSDFDDMEDLSGKYNLLP